METEMFTNIGSNQVRENYLWIKCLTKIVMQILNVNLNIEDSRNISTHLNLKIKVSMQITENQQQMSCYQNHYLQRHWNDHKRQHEPVKDAAGYSALMRNNQQLLASHLARSVSPLPLSSSSSQSTMNYVN